MDTKTRSEINRAPEQDAALLTEHGWHVGDRDPRLNTDHAGRFMVCEPFEESEVPTRDGRNGPWCMVGDDLAELVRMGAEVLRAQLS